MKKAGLILLLVLGFTSVSFAQQSATSQAKPVYLTKASFIDKVFDYRNNSQEWKYKGDKPAIVDFFATWCGPCRATSPILDQLAKEYGDDIYIYKIDVDKEAELASAFGIQSIPTFIFIPQNGNPQIAKGALPKESFRKVIDEVLLKKAPK